MARYCGVCSKLRCWLAEEGSRRGGGAGMEKYTIYESHKEMIDLVDEIGGDLKRLRKLVPASWEWKYEEAKGEILSMLSELKGLLRHCEEICNNE